MQDIVIHAFHIMASNIKLYICLRCPNFETSYYLKELAELRFQNKEINGRREKKWNNMHILVMDVLQKKHKDDYL